MNYHFSEILTSITRKLTEKEKFKNAWQIQVERTIHHSIFNPFHKAVRDFKLNFGRKISYTYYANKRDIKEIVIEFHHFGSFNFHTSKAAGVDKEIQKGKYRKTWKSGNTTSLVVSEQKPLTFKYLWRTNMLKIEAHYMLENKYGTVCSF